MRGRIFQFVAIVAATLVTSIMPEGVVEARIKIQLVLFIISIGVALVGIHLGLDARRIVTERRETIVKYERPHVVNTLEILFVDMA